MKKNYDFLVLGGGVSGLSFAKRVAENGFSVLVVEKEHQLGGLSRSLQHKGFYLDFCAHRFHTKNQELLKEILELPNLKMEEHIKKSRIYMFGKYLKYPFEIQNLLRAMPITQSIPCGISFITNYIKRILRKEKPKLNSYKDWFIDIYGKHLYEVMCFPYTSKIWHIDPSELSADWADQRFQGEDMLKLVKRILKKIFTLDFSGYNIEDDALAPDGGPFYYPLKGIQEMVDALAGTAIKAGADIVTDVNLEKIDTKKCIAHIRIPNGQENIKYGNIISTIPIHQFYSLQEKRSLDIDNVLKEIKYMDIVFVYALINKTQISNDHWLYFPDKNIIFNRAVEFSNWSEKMCPPGKTSICFDITTFVSNPEWEMSEKEITERVLTDASRIGYLKRTDVFETLVVRVKHAYPFYDIRYKYKLDKIVRFLENSGTTYLLGRTGIFRYNNSDNSIEMGFELAEHFVKNTNTKSIYEYIIKEISL